MTNAPLKPCSTCKDGVYIVKAGTDECADCGRKEITPPSPVADDAVEALAFILAAPEQVELDDQEAKRVISQLSKQGYTLRRETMTEAELERELMAKSWKEVPMGGASLLTVDDAFKVAKKYRG